MIHIPYEGTQAGYWLPSKQKIFIRHSANLVYLFWENIFEKIFFSYSYDIFPMRERVQKVSQYPDFSQF